MRDRAVVVCSKIGCSVYEHCRSEIYLVWTISPGRRTILYFQSVSVEKIGIGLVRKLLRFEIRLVPTGTVKFVTIRRHSGACSVD